MYNLPKEYRKLVELLIRTGHSVVQLLNAQGQECRVLRVVLPDGYITIQYGAQGIWVVDPSDFGRSANPCSHRNIHAYAAITQTLSHFNLGSHRRYSHV